MYFSDKLRTKICNKYSINLEPYLWSTEFNDLIMGIKLSRHHEELVHTMEEVYNFGLNIGYCGLTCRYLAIEFPKAEMAKGILSILKGTKGSLTGNHAWIVKDGFVIDPTLRLIIPEIEATKIGYTIERILAYESTRTLSEYELFSNLMKTREQNITKFIEELCYIN